MQRPSRKDIESYNKKDLIEFTEHLLDEVDYSVDLIHQLEKQLERALNELGTKNQTVLEIIEKIENLKSALFSRSSEKITIYDDIFSSKDSSESSDSKKTKNKAKGSSKPKRKKAIEKVSPDTPIHEVFHYASPEEINDLGLNVWKDHFETSDLITIIPTSIQIDRHHRQKYHYTDQLTGERKFFTASGPIKLRDGAQYSIEFVSHVVASKYSFHLPLDRQATMFKVKGLEIPTSSLMNQVDYAAFTLKNSVFVPITEYLEKSNIVEADDTTWPNLEDLKTRKQHKYYLWGMRNKKAVAFNIYNARSQKVAKDFLGKQQGILLSDGHNSFEALVSDKLILASDWAHARRYFVKAEKFYPEECKPILQLINRLFSIEKQIKAKPPDIIIKERQKQSKPVLEELSQLLDSTGHLKSSSLGKAIAYTKRLWERLIVFLDHAELPISTNGIEGSMRTPALGRKNHLGSKNMETAKNAAIWYTIVETCKLNQVNVEAYIAYALATTLKGQKPDLPWEYSA